MLKEAILALDLYEKAFYYLDGDGYSPNSLKKFVSISIMGTEKADFVPKWARKISENIKMKGKTFDLHRMSNFVKSLNKNGSVHAQNH